MGLGLVIVTLTLNAALDRTLTVPNFQRGQRHRASGGLTIAGGKGINIARALKRLEVPVVTTGLAGGLTGTRIVEELTAEAILNDFVRIADESRTSTAVVDPTATSYTEINEWGPHVEDDELEMLREKLRYLTNGAGTVVFAGSLPRGVDEGFYAETIRDLNRRGVKTVLDSEGEPLRLGTSAEPFLVSPNQREAEGLVGQEFHEDQDFMLALDSITELGARNVLITQEAGCFALVREDREVKRYRAVAPRVAGAGEVRTVPSVEERVIELVSENLGVNKEQVNRKTSFIEDLGADSLDIVELIMELEEEFEINIPDEQAEKIKTVGEAIDYIEKEIAKK